MRPPDPGLLPPPLSTYPGSAIASHLILNASSYSNHLIPEFVLVTPLVLLWPRHKFCWLGRGLTHKTCSVSLPLCQTGRKNMSVLKYKWQQIKITRKGYCSWNSSTIYLTDETNYVKRVLLICLFQIWNTILRLITKYITLKTKARVLIMTNLNYDDFTHKLWCTLLQNRSGVFNFMKFKNK